MGTISGSMAIVYGTVNRILDSVDEHIKSK